MPSSPTRLLPGLAVLRTYERAWLRGDIVAGIVLSALLIPAGMGSRFAPTTGAKVDEITGRLRTDIGPDYP